MTGGLCHWLYKKDEPRIQWRWKNCIELYVCTSASRSMWIDPIRRSILRAFTNVEAIEGTAMGKSPK